MKFIRSLILTSSFFLSLTALGQAPATAAPATAKERRLVFLGDSLTEGYGVAKEKAYPYLIEEKMKAAGYTWKVINAGVSGSTSASAKGRMDWQLRSQPDVVFIALGANDGLRGFRPHDLKKNLEEVIKAGQAKKVTLVLAGMQMPPNYGEEYRKNFAKVFTDLAKEYKIALVPFLLDKVAGDKALNLADGIHPNEKGHVIVTDNVWKTLEPVLKGASK